MRHAIFLLFILFTSCIEEVETIDLRPPISSTIKEYEEISLDTASPYFGNFFVQVCHNWRERGRPYFKVTDSVRQYLMSPIFPCYCSSGYHVDRLELKATKDTTFVISDNYIFYIDEFMRKFYLENEEFEKVYKRLSSSSIDLEYLGTTATSKFLDDMRTIASSYHRLQLSSTDSISNLYIFLLPETPLPPWDPSSIYYK